MLDATYQRMPSPLQRGISQPARRTTVLPVTLAAILLYLLLIPQQFSVTIADIYLTPYRLFLLGASLYVMFGALRGTVRYTLPDLLVGVGVAWIWLASFMSSGSLATAAIQGGSHTVDIGLAYFLARITIQTPNDLRRFLILIAPAVALISAIVVAESLSHTLILQPLASSITGQPMPLRADVRVGLLRGTASFPHAILAGIFLASLLPLYLLSGLRGWPKVIGLAASFGGLFTLSSAAMLGLVAGGLLTAYDWISERVGNLTWRLFLISLALLYLAVELTSKSGFYNLMIRYASLNTASAYNRVLIWQYGTENIRKSPWFGIGYSDWDRPDWMSWADSGSFDHFWLIMSLRFGIPETVCLLGASLIGIAMIAFKSSELMPHDARLLRGVAISLGVFVLGVNSVSLWMSALAWFFMLLGIAVSLGSMQSPARMNDPRRRPSDYGNIRRPIAALR